MHLMQQLFPNPLGEAPERIREKVFGPRQTPGQLPGPVTGGGGMAIGGAVSGGTVGYVLYVAAGPVLAQSSSLQYDSTAHTLVVTSVGGGNAAFQAKSTGTPVYVATLATDNAGVGYAGGFSDASGAGNVVFLADGTYAIDVTAGSVNVLGTTGNTYRWGLTTTAPSTTIGVGIVNFYGANATNFLGTPDAWALININGSDYRIPCYI